MGYSERSTMKLPRENYDHLQRAVDWVKSQGRAVIRLRPLSLVDKEGVTLSKGRENLKSKTAFLSKNLKNEIKLIEA